MTHRTIITTPRLWLRELQTTDTATLHTTLGDPATMAHYPAPYTRKQVHMHILACRASYATHGHGLWAVVRRADGVLLGDCGLAYQTVEGQPVLEIGYRLHRAYWGNGYATEAATACRDYAFATLGAAQVVSLVLPGNWRSQRVAAKVHTAWQWVFWGHRQQDYIMHYSNNPSYSSNNPRTHPYAGAGT